ncbi:MAG TPA: insulinase family protein [Polyangiaceae bacterium]|nr:insulinase family protein [Polyangiaceae bacterium]
MSRSRVVGFVLFALTGCAAPAPRSAPSPVVAPPTSALATAPVDELDKALPLDARLTKGRLDNGLTYYVLAHHKPEHRAQVWLVVNAGSVLEDEDQRGLAHFTEHMAFNGTRRFPERALTDFLEKSGVRFGADLNAYTNFDETVYMLQVPTDNPELFKQSFSVLRDWADGISFDPKEVEQERGVVLEEWRLGRGAGMRLFDKQAKVVFAGSKYADRITIGKPEIIQHASRDTLVRYYRDWYRPDLMAVIAVGDFAPSDAEAQIKAEFSTLAPAKSPRPRPVVTLPSHPDTLVSVETDPEMPAASVSILSEFPHRPEASARDYRRKIGEHLFNTMLNERFEELSRKPDAPFLGANSSTSGLTRSTDVFRQSAAIRDDAALTGFSALLEEVLRVERHGFTQGELERAKSQLLRRFQHAVKERDKTDSRDFAAEISRNFLQEETMPGAEAELALVERFLPTFSLPELNQLGKTMGAGSRVILVNGSEHLKKPHPEALLALSHELEATQIAAYSEANQDLTLMAQNPAPGSVLKTSTVADLDITRWTLKNGVEVIAKPTSFANDDVRLTAFSPGGSSLVKDADFASARFADSVVALGGLGAFDAIQLRKALAGKLASVTPHIGELDEGLSGRASSGDLELLFQLTYLTMTAPRRDESTFNAWRAREVERTSHRLLSPELTFFEELQTLTSQNHSRRRPVTPDLLQQIDLDKAFAIYRDRLGDASDFTFVFVGNFSLDELKPLAETYLGSLPARGRKEKWRDTHVTWPRGIQRKVVVKGHEPKSLVTLNFHGKQPFSRDAADDLEILQDVLRHRLREILREDMGGVYGVQVNGRIARRPREEYTLSINFGCQPENVDKLTSAVFSAISELQQRGIADDYLLKVKEERRRAHETELLDNGYWLHELERVYTFGDDPHTIVDLSKELERATSERVRASAKRYLDTKEYVLGVLKPEG